jgi:hypothetical protein
VSRLSRQCGILNISQTYKPPRSVTGIALLYFALLYCYAANVIPITKLCRQIATDDSLRHNVQRCQKGNILFNDVLQRKQVQVGTGACWSSRPECCIKRAAFLSLPDVLGKNCNLTHRDGRILEAYMRQWNSRYSSSMECEDNWKKKFPDKTIACSHMLQPAKYIETDKQQELWRRSLHIAIDRGHTMSVCSHARLEPAT